MPSVRNMVNQFAMNAKWETDKMSCNFHKKEKKREDMTQDELMLDNFRRQLENDRKNSEDAAIYNKIASGAELTSDELAKLREKNPQMYNEYMADKAEEKGYEKKLRNCKTKEDVDRLHANKISAENAKFMSIVNDPNIPKSEKYRQAVRALGKITKLSEIVKAFKESEEYSELPTDEELKEAQKEKNKEFIPEEEKEENSGDNKADIPLELPEKDKEKPDYLIAASGGEKPSDVITDSDIDTIKKVATAEKTVGNQSHAPAEKPAKTSSDSVGQLQDKVVTEIKAKIRSLSSKSDRMNISV